MYTKFVKRIFDFTISLLLLVVFAPVLLLISVLLLIVNKGQPFFIQERPGKHCKIFKVFKFKTMNDNRDEKGNLMPDEFRLTRVGRFVRSTSLDELPQLFNVLKGDMSFVGPRPLLVQYLPLYNADQARRHNALPGITGWAQVNGRNTLTWERKFEYDIYYVDNVSFVLDLKILLLTIKKVFKKEGISSDSSATMEKFTGTRND